MSAPLILLVEDEPSSAEVLAFYLQLQGFSVVQKDNGQSALEWLHETRPSLVLTDVMMPYMDGRELCRRIRADADLSSIPIIVLTAAASLKLEDCEPDAVLRKPTDLEALLKTIRRLIDHDGGSSSSDDRTASPSS